MAATRAKVKIGSDSYWRIVERFDSAGRPETIRYERCSSRASAWGAAFLLISGALAATCVIPPHFLERVAVSFGLAVALWNLLRDRKVTPSH